MALLVVMVLVVLVEVTHVLVVLFQPLPGAGGNSVLFFLVDFGRRSRRTGGTIVAGLAISTASATAASATAAAGIPLFTSRIFDAAGPCRTIGGFCRGSFVQVDVVDPRQTVILLQIGIEVQIAIEFTGPRLLSANFIASRSFAPRWWAVIAPWSRRAGFAAARVFAPRLFTARLFAAWGRSVITARRNFVTSRWGYVAAGGRGSFIATPLGPPNLLAPLVAASSTLIIAASFASSAPIGSARALFIARARTLVSAGFGNWRCGFFLFENVHLIEIWFVEIRFHDLRAFFKVVIQGKARVVLEAPRR